MGQKSYRHGVRNATDMGSEMLQTWGQKCYRVRNAIDLGSEMLQTWVQKCYRVRNAIDLGSEMLQTWGQKCHRVRNAIDLGSEMLQEWDQKCYRVRNATGMGSEILQNVWLPGQPPVHRVHLGGVMTELECEMLDLLVMDTDLSVQFPERNGIGVSFLAFLCVWLLLFLLLLFFGGDTEG